MLYLTCTTITSVDLAHYGVSRAKDWVSVYCGTMIFNAIGKKNNAIGKKNNQTSVSDADREIPTLGSTDINGNSVNLASGIVRLPLGWDFSVCIGDRFYFSLSTVVHFPVLQPLVLTKQ